MLDALKFVTAAIAKKDYVPELTHYKIENGRVTCFNGIFALSSDIDIDLDVRPQGNKFLAALRAAPEEVIALNMTPTGRLAVKSGKFKAYIDCIEAKFQVFVEPEGEEIEIDESFIKGLKALLPLTGIDASRPQFMGVKVQNQFMFATNNVMLGQYWHGLNLPFDVVIPDVAVAELLRIDEVPTKVQLAEKSISFWFGENRWLRTNLLENGSWPTDKFDQILSMSTGEQLPFPDEFFENVDLLKPFLNDAGTIYLTPEYVSTSRHEGDGTQVEVELKGITEMQAYHHKQLMILKQVAKTIDWSAYPNPIMFRGERLRGALVGQRL